MHTGNAAVITTSVMNPLWVGNAIIRDGLPCFNPNIVTLRHRGPVEIVAEKWPYDLDRQQPKTSSKAAQIFAYGLPHFSVSAPNSSLHSLVHLFIPGFLRLFRPSHLWFST